ncbi:MAG: DNA replication/repair protein RecF [Solirubrobacterales bacterium]|nr:DNA replication/repair protein RecF [Solirubrobacterales bacterium]
MRLAALEALGFRNLAAARVELGPAIVVLHGPNGSGKTNMLEAVYFGLTNRSFRTGNDRDLIAFDEPAARVELELEGSAGHSVLLSALERGGERRHRIDGRKLDTAGERPLVSVFHPDRLALVKGPAAHRRAHLDRLIAALWPARADLRSRFGRTLAQRNALVARINAGQAPAGSLPSWDERLADEAEPLITSRSEAVESLSAPFAELAGALGLESAEVSYRPRHGGGREELAAELAARRSADLGRAYTSYGPQLDEVEMRLGGRALRRFGSQGQQRAALLALLFAERTALIDAGRSAPIMLLDDVMSELDPERRALLVGSLAGAGQALLTATEAAHVPAAPGADITSIAVSGGAALRSAAAPPGAEEAA